MRKVLMGNHAAALGACLARAQVVSAYPITPQTQVVEHLSELEAQGAFPGRLVRVESEHSAMAVLLGAATAGARTFTATSSQGLAYMHELLHWVAGSRLPVVMVDVNRALAAPWMLWTDQSDSLSQRDTGWMQFYCASGQEVLDTVIMSYKIAEKVMIPAMVVMDGFTLSHTYEPVEVPSQEAVDSFLEPYRPQRVLDPEAPLTFGALVGPKDYIRLRRRLSSDMDEALNEIQRAGLEFGRAFGRTYGLFEAHRLDGAKVVLVSAGAAASTAEAAVDELRRQGLPAASLRLRSFRPFPAEALSRLLEPGVSLAVVDRSCSPGGTGIFFEEIKAALYARGERNPVYGYVAGLGGGDITVELLSEIWREVYEGKADPRSFAWMEESR